ncbi:uncharacterized protein isoform X2 [Rhodnius prolixus]|uniref:uncharacterized protein isoform X2 n=1 Tax=Rhodnius prolixus TaxID=13249 RepID=UPI003D18934C
MNNQEKLGVELQKSLHEAQMYHTHLHALYYKYKSCYDAIVKLTPEEVDLIYKYDLHDTVNRIKKRFWKTLEIFTNVFFSVSNLLLLKENTEKKIENSSELHNFVDKHLESGIPRWKILSGLVLESNSDSRSLDINVELEWQIKAISASITYAEHNMMKFRFATRHAPEFMSRIRVILKWPHSKWNGSKLKGLNKNLKLLKNQELILLEHLEKLRMIKRNVSFKASYSDSRILKQSKTDPNENNSIEKIKAVSELGSLDGNYKKHHKTNYNNIRPLSRRRRPFLYKKILKYETHCG